MAQRNEKPANYTVLMDGEGVAAAVHRMAQEIIDAHPELDQVALLGILTRGRPLAERLSTKIYDMTGTAPRVGSLSTTLYRDDLRSGKIPPNVGMSETHFDFNVDGLIVILVDDVIAAGRTARAALDEVMDYGRPARIQLACLIDRRVRELPIQPDFRGWLVAPEADGPVTVRLEEVDGEDAVLLEHVVPPAEERGA